MRNRNTIIDLTGVHFPLFVLFLIDVHMCICDIYQQGCVNTKGDDSYKCSCFNERRDGSLNLCFKLRFKYHCVYHWLFEHLPVFTVPFLANWSSIAKQQRKKHTYTTSLKCFGGTHSVTIGWEQNKWFWLLFLPFFLYSHMVFR